MPASNIFSAAGGDCDISTFCELDRHERGNVGNGKVRPRDELIVGKLPIEQLEKPTQGLFPPLGQSRNLRDAPRNTG